MRNTGLGFLLLGPQALKSVTWLKPNQPTNQPTSPALSTWHHQSVHPRRSLMAGRRPQEGGGSCAPCVPAHSQGTPGSWGGFYEGYLVHCHEGHRNVELISSILQLRKLRPQIKFPAVTVLHAPGYGSTHGMTALEQRERTRKSSPIRTKAIMPMAGRRSQREGPSGTGGIGAVWRVSPASSVLCDQHWESGLGP